ncbi:hypothetical protein [Kitasatospora sp. NPDC059803]|uniref:hypothetical protein n=1 Tax=Kitasatospora sp. NPDC059803 TaxID=3346953 RepID=UPI00364E5079
MAQVEILRRVWVHHYVWDARGRLCWRDGHALPPASLRFDSPYDTDAHYCVKRDTARSGYRTHFTETCTSELPEVVVHVATTIAPVQDGELTPVIHNDLAAISLTPAEHVVDAAYTSPAHIEPRPPGARHHPVRVVHGWPFARTKCAREPAGGMPNLLAIRRASRRQSHFAAQSGLSPARIFNAACQRPCAPQAVRESAVRAP